MSIRVLITDDHKVVRRGLDTFLSLDPELEVVGEAGNGEEALRLARELRPGVVLMDLLMPAMDGIEATQALGATESSGLVGILVPPATRETTSSSSPGTCSRIAVSGSYGPRLHAGRD